MSILSGISRKFGDVFSSKNPSIRAHSEEEDPENGRSRTSSYCSSFAEGMSFTCKGTPQERSPLDSQRHPYWYVDLQSSPLLLFIYPPVHIYIALTSAVFLKSKLCLLAPLIRNTHSPYPSSRGSITNGNSMFPFFVEPLRIDNEVS